MGDLARASLRADDVRRRRGDLELDDDVTLAASVVPQAVIDAGGIVVRANRAFAELFGARFVVGTPLVALAAFADTAPIWRVLRERRMREESWRIDVECELSSGRRSLELCFRRLTAHRDSPFAVSIVDVTERVEATRDARRAHERELELRSNVEAMAKASARLLDASAPKTPIIEALPHILDAAMEAVDARQAAIVILRGTGDDVVAWRGCEACPVDHLQERLARARISRSADGAQTARLPPARAHEIARTTAAHRQVSSLSSLLTAHDGARGLLYVYERSDGGQFTAGDQALLDAIAGRAAQTIEVAAFRHRMNREHGWLSIAFERSSDPIVFIDADGEATLNRRATTLLGVHFFAKRGRMQPRFVGEVGEEIPPAAHPVARAFQGVATTGRALRIDGVTSSIDVVVDATPVRSRDDAEVSGVVLFFRSVSPKRARRDR